MSNEVGSRLKEIRQSLKMTQAQLGEKLRINGSTVVSFVKPLRGKIKPMARSSFSSFFTFENFLTS